MADLIIIIPILLFSVIVHEIAHGYVALRCGDPTARDAGRLTFNPLPHIDPFMTVILPLFLIFSHSGIIFGGAKPVPVNPFLLRGGEKDHVKVTAAGPASNFLLALAAFLLSLPVAFACRLSTSPLAYTLLNVLNLVIFYNLILANFNLIPVPPLDGSWILSYFLKGEAKSAYRRLQASGFLGFAVFMILAWMVPGFFRFLFSPALKLMSWFQLLQGA